MATGVATFTGRPRSYFEAARVGDPVLIYVSRPDHAVRAVGVVSHVTRPAGAGDAGDHRASGSAPEEGAGPAPAALHAGPQIEVQLAFELPNPLRWRELMAAGELAGAEPVRQRSSGTLFLLTEAEYRALQALIVARNPELKAAFATLDARGAGAQPEQSEAVQEPEAAGPPHGEPTSTATLVRERPAPYAPGRYSPALPVVRSLADLQALTYLPAALLAEVRDLLEDTGQIILSGPPGTGKTWLARGLASLMAGHPDRVRVVQFHPSTAYEDFIEGLKPRVDAQGNVTYAVVPGLFVRLCRQALCEPDHSYVLVIDEINRAPLSRVFGELLYALEYRGPQGAVELSVSAGTEELPAPFFVPENVLIIGTMNSADRSLALVDYALRRRFRFVELEPNPHVLQSWLSERGVAPARRAILLDLFGKVNARLAEALDADHRLGHSYFMLDPADGPMLDRLWRTAIKPLLAEYFIPPAGELEEYQTLFAEAVAALERTQERKTKQSV